MNATHTTLPPSVLTKQQYKSFGPRADAQLVKHYGKGAALWAHVRYDDECGNGHNTFAITGTVRLPGKREPDAWGCLHEDIARVFPEFAPLIKWHGCSSDGPLHYISNTKYLASERDCWGKLKDEPRRYEHVLRIGDSPISHRISGTLATFLQARMFRDQDGHIWYATNQQGLRDDAGEFKALEVAHPRDPKTFGPKFTLVGYDKQWHECPYDSQQEAEEFCLAFNTRRITFDKIATSFGEGKVRELAAARKSAIWPEATDEELTAPDLEARLAARLPALLVEFKAAVESLGFTY